MRSRMSTTYAFDNATTDAFARLQAIAELFDASTIRHLSQRGVREGWSCLEVGAGAGTIAYWLARRVGAGGRVLATDLDIRHLQWSAVLPVPQLEIARHDITREPLPDGTFDLVHARLVVMHLADKAEALRRMIAALKPGGWLMVEDFDSDQPVGTMPTAFRALRRALEARGIDVHWGARQPDALRSLGLAEVDAEGVAKQWRTGTPGAALMHANYVQLRREVLDTGLLTARELDAEVARLNGPTFTMRSPILWTAWGRRPL